MSNAIKKHPYRAAFAAMLVTLVVACSGSVDMSVTAKPGAEATLEAAMQADRDFAAMSAKDGAKAAFAAFLDPTDSQKIDPGAVTIGAEKIAEAFAQAPPDFALAWTPDGGFGSQSGDLAVTTGRYATKIAGVTRGEGRYVTVWRKDGQGALKAVMDLGVPDPAAPPSTAPDPEGRPG